MKQRIWNIIIDYYSVLLFIILNAAGMSILETHAELFVFVNIIILSSFFLYRKRKVDAVLIGVLCFWLMINLLADMVNMSSINLNTLIGTSGRIIIAYLILKVVGFSFFDKWYKVCFGFACVAIVIYPFLLLSHNVFYQLSPYLNFITKDAQRANGGWYVVFYMFNGWAGIRNSGFMWEPGGFSCMLIPMIFFRLWRNGVKVDWHIVVLLLNLITTYSTSGYLALFFVVLYYVFMNKAIFRSKVSVILLPVILILLLWGAYYSYNTFDFMGSKIEKYLDLGETVYYSPAIDRLRTNRLGYFTLALKRIVEWPLGYGVVTPDYDVRRFGVAINAPNSIAAIMQEWGIIGILLFAYAIYRYSNLQYIPTKYNYLYVGAMFIVLFSNPLHVRSFIYVLFFYPFVYGDCIKKHESKNKYIIQQQMKNKLNYVQR